MSATGVQAFDQTIATAIPWLNDLSDHLGWNDRDRAYKALRSVLHTLRDRLGVNEACHFAAQLPLILRGTFFEGWHAAGKPLKLHRDEFLERIDRDLQHEVMDSDQICRAVFGTLRRHVSPGEIANIRTALPEDLRDLWP
jgi:uncharacterized protein (DUF2267 family)